MTGRGRLLFIFLVSAVLAGCMQAPIASVPAAEREAIAGRLMKDITVPIARPSNRSRTMATASLRATIAGSGCGGGVVTHPATAVTMKGINSARILGP